MSLPDEAWQVRGWIAPFVECLVSILSGVGRFFVKSPEVPQNSTPEERHDISLRRAKRVDTFVAVCGAVGVVSFVLICTSSSTLIRNVSVGFLVWRIVDVLATDVKISLFDDYAKRNKRYVYSWPSRVILLGFFNYVELIICFAGIYAFDICKLADSTHHLGWIVNETAEKALHLSIATQVTVGYGDIVPTDWLRPVSWAQMFAGLIVIVLFVARYLALLPSGGSRLQSIDSEKK